ncbi:MAG: hypothetical protein EHM20_11690 [Alphaproteobacteria bacterium]|nr:MAG: hypothetical protein EHM20_11690 [Alphaproteobacteria bacterium]
MLIPNVTIIGEIDWSATGSMISAIGTWGFGSLAVVSLLYLREQIKQAKEQFKQAKESIEKAKESIISSSYHSTHNLMIEIDRHFFDHPEMIKYFRDKAELSSAQNDKEKMQVKMTAEMLADYFDNVFHQKGTLPTTDAYMAFQNYMQETYANSPALNEYLNKKEGWHSKDFIQMLTNSKTKKDVI